MNRYTVVTIRRAIVAAITLSAMACADDKKAPDPALAGSATTSASPAVASAPPAAPTTGDPDHDFLRAMADHHKGLILMAHETIESKEKLGVKDLAKRIDSEQDEELDKISTMLEKDFKDPYAPKATPANEALAAQLTGKAGADYDHTFIANVIAHHEESIKMIDAFVPTARNAAVKTIAANMKEAEIKEVADLRGKLSSK